MTKKKIEVGYLIKKEFKELATVGTTYTAEQKDFIIKTIAPSLNEEEIRLFIYRCQKLGLNPLEGEIFAYTSHDTVAGVRQRKMVVIVARDGKRKLAFKTGHLESIHSSAIYVKSAIVKEGKTTSDKIVQVEPWEGGKLWGARCIVRRDDMEKPFIVIVPLSEYVRTNAIWRSKPETMIKKVAESQCLSTAFPELAGVYDESERFDNSSVNSPLADGHSLASKAQVLTLKALGGTISEGLTKQQAADQIKNSSTKK